MAWRELAKQMQKRWNMTSIGFLPESALASADKAEDDYAFLGMFADAAPTTSEERATFQIQACYGGRGGRGLASRQRHGSVAATSDVDFLGPATFERARQSLVGEANLEIGRMLQRASLTREEAAAVGDRLGGTLPSMVDTASPPASPTASALGDLMSRQSFTQQEENKKELEPWPSVAGVQQVAGRSAFACGSMVAKALQAGNLQ